MQIVAPKVQNLTSLKVQFLMAATAIENECTSILEFASCGSQSASNCRSQVFIVF